MGNFEEGQPSISQMQSLEVLLTYLASTYELDLTAEEYFHGQITPNLIAHRDVGATLCPGQFLYDYLPNLRAYLATTQAIKDARSFFRDGLPNGSLPIIRIKQGQEQTFRVSFRNTGNTTWGSDTWLFALAGDGIEIVSQSPSRSYVADYLDGQVRPQQTATFEVKVRAVTGVGLRSISLVPIVRNKRIHNAETLQLVEVQEVDWGGSLKQIVPQNIVTGAEQSVRFRVQNVGETTWQPSQLTVYAKLFGYTGQQIPFALQSAVAPGAIGEFVGDLPALPNAGKKPITFTITSSGRDNIVVRDILTFSDPIVSAKALRKLPKVTLAERGDPLSLQIAFQNTGNIAWQREDLQFKIIQKTNIWSQETRQQLVQNGESAVFDLRLPVEKQTQVYIMLLKYKDQRLWKHVMVVRGKEGQNTVKESYVRDSKPISPTPSPQERKPKVDDRLMRVRLSFPHQNAQVRYSDTVTVRCDGNAVGALKDQQTAAVHRSGSLKVSYDGYQCLSLRFEPISQDIATLTNWQRYPAWDVRKIWNDNRFFGVIELRNIDGELVVINELPMYHYLQGVAETIEANHIEKKKALAIVARSYAAYYLDHQKFTTNLYNGNDDPNAFQRYLGQTLADRSPQWLRTVDATTDQVMTYNGKTIKTPFHSSSGGKTLSAQTKWGWTNTPYLPSVADPGCRGVTAAGHRVGMSGCGAEHWAQQGWDYKKILEYYYPSARIANSSR